MADPQPRRYITRARAQASGVSSSKTTTTTTSSIGKRKALAESTLALENSRSQADNGNNNKSDALALARNHPPATTTRTTRSGKSAVKRSAAAPRSKTASHSSGLSAAPRRSGRTAAAAAAAVNAATTPTSQFNDFIDAKTARARTLAHVKKVAFASPPSEDKENAVPCKPLMVSLTAAEKTSSKHHPPQETDELMSTSMGALSVKPKRVTRSKLPPPTTGIFAEPIPALSPLKARRPKRVLDGADDKALEDELLCPTSPGLLDKPKRPMMSLAKKHINDGADLLMRPTNAASKPPSALFGSPARRLPQSPSKPKASSSSDLQASPSRPAGGLATPPRRSRGVGSALGMSVSKPAIPGSRLKFSITNTMDASDDPFSDLSNGSSGPRLIGDNGSFLGKPALERASSVKQELPPATAVSSASPTLQEVLDPTARKSAEEAPDVNSTSAIHGTMAASPTPPPSRLNVAGTSPTDGLRRHPVTNGEDNSFFTKKEGEGGVPDANADGDISMDAIPKPAPSPASLSIALPTVIVKKHSSPSEGGSSFGLFGVGDDEDNDDNMDCDSENVPPAAVVTTLASRFDSIDLDRQKRGFGQEIDLSTRESSMSLFDDIPVDPMLLSEDISDVVIGYCEAPLPAAAAAAASATKIPVNFLSDSDGVFGNDKMSQYKGTADVFGVNGLPPQSVGKSVQQRRRSSNGCERIGGFLAGAVVFVDAYTEDGAKCSENFERMLKAMGAKVFKQWSWDPDATSPGRVGITHVVFKDGSPRTLQKVKAAKGLVSCVALAWVVQCAERNEWLDESLYAVDLDDVPLGGHKVRFLLPAFLPHYNHRNTDESYL